MTRPARNVAITLRRRPAQPRADAIVEGSPELAHTDDARERLVQAFVDLYADVLVDALARLARGADPVAAVRAALVVAEGGAS